jgi:hypothetical protein
MKKAFSGRIQIHYFPAVLKNSFTASFGTIDSLKMNAPVFPDFTILITLVKSFPVAVWNVATTFFAITRLFYLI